MRVVDILNASYTNFIFHSRASYFGWLNNPYTSYIQHLLKGNNGLSLFFSVTFESKQNKF